MMILIFEFISKFLNHNFSEIAKKKNHYARKGGGYPYLNFKVRKWPKK